MTTNETIKLCQCEHNDHFDQVSGQHAYSDACASGDPLVTNYGKYELCDACRDAGHMQFVSVCDGEVSGLDPAERPAYTHNAVMIRVSCPLVKDGYAYSDGWKNDAGAEQFVVCNMAGDQLGRFDESEIRKFRIPDDAPGDVMADETPVAQCSDCDAGDAALAAGDTDYTIPPHDCPLYRSDHSNTQATNMAEALDEAEEKAIDALSRYKFQMFGYWSSIWVHLNRISGEKRPSPFADLVKSARILKSGQITNYFVGSTVRIRPLLTETRCRTCRSGSAGTCTPSTADPEFAHAWDPEKQTIGVIIK